MNEWGMKNESGYAGQGEGGGEGNSVCKAAGGREGVGANGNGVQVGMEGGLVREGTQISQDQRAGGSWTTVRTLGFIHN